MHVPFGLGPALGVCARVQCLEWKGQLLGWEQAGADSDSGFAPFLTLGSSSPLVAVRRREQVGGHAFVCRPASSAKIGKGRVMGNSSRSTHASSHRCPCSPAQRSFAVRTPNPDHLLMLLTGPMPFTLPHPHPRPSLWANHLVMAASLLRHSTLHQDVRTHVHPASARGPSPPPFRSPARAALPIAS